MALGQIGVDIDVPDDIPFLGIKKGPAESPAVFLREHLQAVFTARIFPGRNESH